MKKLFFTIALIMIGAMAFSQNKNKPNYKLIVDSVGPNAKMGDIVIAHLKYKNEKDSFDTYKYGSTLSFPLLPSFKGGIEEGLTHASKGDSVMIWVSNDSLYSKFFKIDLPAEIKPKAFTSFYFKVIDIKREDEIRKELEESNTERIEQEIKTARERKQQVFDTSKVQLKKDDAKIMAYINNNNLTMQRTEIGVYYHISKEGRGIRPEPGDTIKILYAGRLLNGKEFDKSKPESPVTAEIGIGFLIIGVEDGVMKMKQGSKATIIMPSSFAYGVSGIKGSGDEYTIPPNAPLIFDIELLEVRKWKK